MRKILLNITDFAPQNISSLVLIVAGCVWVAVWAILLADVLLRPKSVWWKLFWLPVSSVPVFGGILYAMAELLGADWRAAMSFRQHDAKSEVAKKNKRAARKVANAH